MQGWQITNIASVEKIDDYTIAAHTTIEDSLLPYEITGYFQVSNCAVTKAQQRLCRLSPSIRPARDLTSSTRSCRMSGWNW